MSTLQKSAAWYEAITSDLARFGPFHCQANASIIWKFIEESGMPINAASVISALQEAEFTGSLNGVQLAVVRNEQAIAAAREKREQDEAAEQERKRISDVVAANRHFELVEFVIKHRGVSDPNGLRVERDIVSRWSLEALEQAAAGIQLHKSSRGQTASEFAKAQGLDKVDSTGREIKKSTGVVPLPDGFGAEQYRKMRPAEIRIMVNKIAARGYDDRAIWRAINQRVAETAGV